MSRLIRLALDWTPNTNHAGFYVARHLGFFSSRNLDVHFILPGEAAAQGQTPARLVASEGAEVAITPSESAVSFATSDPGKPRMRAIAAVLQGSTSSICTLKASGIDRPSKLVGRRYASYNGRFEDPIVARMVKLDGGDPNQVIFHPLPMHAYADEASMTKGSVVAAMMEKGMSDSTWIFNHWEGVLAERNGQELNYFALEDYSIPYGYSPVMLAHPEMLATNGDALKDFLAACANGFKFATTNPKEAAAILCQEAAHPSLEDVAFVEASQLSIADKYLADGEWGAMEAIRWEAFVGFLFDAGILTDRDGAPIPRERVDVEALFTNDYLPTSSP